MRRATPILAILMVFALLAGCGSTPRERYSQVNDTFINSLQTLTEAKRADVFSDEEWDNDIVPLIQSANEILREYDAVTKAGIEDESAAQRFSRLLARLQPYIVEATTSQEGG